MAIFKDITITVKQNTAILSDNIYLYLGDGGITLLISVIQNNCKFGNFKSGKTNIVEETESRWASICVEKADGEIIISDRCEIWDGKIRFEITKEFVNDISEAGIHKLQIHLYDSESEDGNRYTVPPVEFNVLEPLCGAKEPLLYPTFYKYRTSDGTNYRYLFFCYSGNSLEFIYNWDTSKVTDMSNMFARCFYITELDLSHWDVSNVTDADGMFDNCYSLEILDIRNWNFEHNNDLFGFTSCTKLHTIRADNCNARTLENLLRGVRYHIDSPIEGVTRTIYCNEQAFSKCNVGLPENWEFVFVN